MTNPFAQDYDEYYQRVNPEFSGSVIAPGPVSSENNSSNADNDTPVNNGSVNGRPAQPARPARPLPPAVPPQIHIEEDSSADPPPAYSAVDPIPSPSLQHSEYNRPSPQPPSPSPQQPPFSQYQEPPPPPTPNRPSYQAYPQPYQNSPHPQQYQYQNQYQYQYQYPPQQQYQQTYNQYPQYPQYQNQQLSPDGQRPPVPSRPGTNQPRLPPRPPSGGGSSAFPGNTSATYGGAYRY